MKSTRFRRVTQARALNVFPFVFVCAVRVWSALFRRVLHRQVGTYESRGVACVYARMRVGKAVATPQG